jgi:hypothetical protein
MYTHTHTHTHTHTIYVRLSLYVCRHVPTAAQPHLKGVRVSTTCASVCAATISVCLFMYVRVS